MQHQHPGRERQGGQIVSHGRGGQHRDGGEVRYSPEGQWFEFECIISGFIDFAVLTILRRCSILHNSYVDLTSIIPETI